MCSCLLMISVSCKESTTDDKLLAEDKTTDGPLFERLSSDRTGIDFSNINEENDSINVFKYFYHYNGSGVAVSDLNNDGLQDVVFVANMSPNKVYINKGDFKFDDISESSGINAAEMGWSTGVTTVDINNDGYQDIYISRSGRYLENEKRLVRNLLYINNGDATFREAAAEYGLDGYYYTTQACFFDYDNDGDQDLYLLNHPNNFNEIKSLKGNILPPDLPNEDKFSDQFFVNEDGKYVNKTKEMGLENRAFGLGVVAFDYNNDGFKDLFVSNDFKMPNVLLKNQNGKGFTDETESAIRHMAKFSMGVDFGDINNDGYQDVVTMEMLAADNFRKKTNMLPMNTEMYWEYVRKGKQYQDMHNMLQLNTTNGNFSEISWLSNMAETDWSWSPLLADFDNDGYQDLYITNGFKRDINSKDFMNSDGMQSAMKGNDYSFMDLAPQMPSFKVSNYMYHNKGDLTFHDETKDWGLYDPGFSYGSAYADFDNDGNLDLIVSNMNEEAFVYRNNGSGNSYLKYNLKNGQGFAFGSKIEIWDDGLYQSKQFENTHGYQSKSESSLHFGTANRKSIDSVLITWFDGKKTLLTNVNTNKTYDVDYKNTSFDMFDLKNTAEPYFAENSSNMNVNYIHEEIEHDDYARELLLPHKLSQEGPFMDVADVNGDGMEDFFVGNGRGFAGSLYLQKSDGTFSKKNQAAFNNDKDSEDIGVLFFDYDADGDQDLYVVSGSNEINPISPLYHDRLYQNDGQGNFTKTKNVIPEIKASGSTVVAGDVDGDGDLDLFVGGFVVPGQYPKAGNSQLLINENGTFVDKSLELAQGLKDIGMVKDAVFEDINKDGTLDLIVVGHWMPITIFINKNDAFVNQSAAYGTDDTVGWWNTIVVEDFNKDGQMDFVAGNLGLNTKHKASKEGPFKVMAKDFDGNGTNDIALGYYNDGTFYPVRGKQCSSEQIPSIKKNFKSYTEFGNASFEELYSHFDQTGAIKYEATLFETSLFTQNNGMFEVTSLPNECQFAPTNSIVFMDVNNDGQKEIVSVGNHHPVEIETGRYDAHIGNVVSLDADGTMNALPLSMSGFFTPNDARDLQPIQIGGQSYLLVSNNRGKLQFIKTNKTNNNSTLALR